MRPVILMILDGYGLWDVTEGNAVKAADTPFIRSLMKDYPFVLGAASGLAVGLPEGQMGNSEVGHLNMGAGRVVYQDLTRITKSIEDGDFFENPELLKAVDNAIENGSDLHIWGLVSDGGVHSHNTHLYALLKLAKQRGLDRVYVHCFMDGRDTSPTSGIDYIKELNEKCAEYTGRIATITGRYWAMDRDNRWERVERAYRALTEGIGVYEEDPVKAMENSYARDITDEFIEPTVICRDGKPLSVVKDGDSVIFFNFRPDRAREISRTFCCSDFDGFERGRRIETTYICFTEYDVTIPNKEIAFKEVEIEDTFGEFLSRNGLTQARIAETEKYAHVTFFFSGGREEPFQNEDRILVASPKVATYDLQPQMSAPEVAKRLIKAIQSQRNDMIILNFANGDMVGHTGVYKAIVEAVETVDKLVGEVVKVARDNGYSVIITADHGNADYAVNSDGTPNTQHSLNPVQFVVVDDDVKSVKDGRLCDIAPTMLSLMGIEKPDCMTGEVLVTI